MLVYAALYKLRNGVYPKKAVLYFLNELDRPGVNSRPENVLYSVDISEDDINKKQKNKRVESTSSSCAICDIRWSCSSFIQFKKPPMVYLPSEKSL